MDDKMTKESLEPKKIQPSLIKILTLGMTSSLILACSPTVGYTMQKGDSQTQKQEYAQEFLKSYPAEHSSFIYSREHGGYLGSGYYSPWLTDKTQEAKL